jgi:hypothetical protein
MSMATLTLLDRGMLLRDLPATTLARESVRVSDFRGRRNLVLVFSGDDREEAPLLVALRAAQADLQEEEAVVLIANAAGELREIYGAISPQGHPLAAVFITDRYGEIFFAARGTLPDVPAVLDWLRFINAQCPE